jgi:hypothetical protein
VADAGKVPLTCYRNGSKGMVKSSRRGLKEGCGQRERAYFDVEKNRMGSQKYRHGMLPRRGMEYGTKGGFLCLVSFRATSGKGDLHYKIVDHEEDKGRGDRVCPIKWRFMLESRK